MSEIKVNKITPRTNCGTTQLGDSGDTFTIPSGATITNSGTASGFGATGAVSWDVASIKTTGFTATTGGAGGGATGGGPAGCRPNPSYGQANTGGGGRGDGAHPTYGQGGSGVVLIKYKFQN